MKKFLKKWWWLLLIIVVIGAGYGTYRGVQHYKQVQEEKRIASHPADITVNEFVKAVAPVAQREQKKYHLKASITIAQAGLESNWGRSKLARKYNNLFGVKATAGHRSVTLPTTETINGKTRNVKAKFNVYSSWNASIRAHTKLLMMGTSENHNRYKSVTQATSYKKAARELQKDGYATDPEYANKLIYAIKKFDLAKYDK